MLSRRIMVRLEPELMDHLEKRSADTHTPVSILARQAVWAFFGKKLGGRRRARTAKTTPRRS